MKGIGKVAGGCVFRGPNGEKDGTRGRDRTADLGVMIPSLLPTELPWQKEIQNSKLQIQNKVKVKNIKFK